MKARIKLLLSRLRKYRRPIWYITIATWISCAIACILHPSIYLLRIVEAIVVFYWSFCIAVAETKERRMWCITWLIVTIILILF